MNLKIVLSLLIFEENEVFMENFDNSGKGEVERRKHQRYTIPAAVICKFFNKDLEGNNSFQGFIQDISFGGVNLNSLLLIIVIARNYSDIFYSKNYYGPRKS